MSDDQELEEFYEDFGAQPLSGSELDAMMERARTASDVQLRRLVKEVQTLRWLVPVLLERIEKSGSPVDDVNDQVLKIARFLVR
jgi:hypothetical protein